MLIFLDVPGGDGGGPGGPGGGGGGGVSLSSSGAYDGLFVEGGPLFNAEFLIVAGGGGVVLLNHPMYCY